MAAMLVAEPAHGTHGTHASLRIARKLGQISWPKYARVSLAPASTPLATSSSSTQTTRMERLLNRVIAGAIGLGTFASIASTSVFVGMICNPSTHYNTQHYIYTNVCSTVIITNRIIS